MKIVLWNARGIKNKKVEIIRRFQEFDVVIVTEMKNKTNEKCNIPGFNVAIKDSQRVGKVAAGGIAIMVLKNIKIRELESIKSNSVNIEVLGLQIVGTDKEINILAFYRRPGEVVERGNWKKIIKKVGQIRNTLCVRDFNAHNQLWNCERTDKNGEILQDEMEECDLFVINRDTLSRVGEGGRRYLNIDLGFGSADIVCITTYINKLMILGDQTTIL